jgi:hypothetical protein
LDGWNWLQAQLVSNKPKKPGNGKPLFFETFNFLEKTKTDEPEKSKFICFDTYGEKLKVRSLLDLQTAFYENISQLK